MQNATWAVKEYVVILDMPQVLLQPVQIIGQVLHTEDQTSVWAESERRIFHHIIYLYQLTDIYTQQKTNKLGQFWDRQKKCVLSLKK